MTELLHGIDVSKWNGRINWGRVAAAGKRFTIIKASQGRRTDPRFAENWADAFAAGLTVGAYCYLDARFTAEEQAHAFLDTYWKHDVYALPPALDVEDAGAMSPAELTCAVLAWCAIVEETTGATPWIYTSPGFAARRLDPAAELTRYPLWVAHWGVAAPEVPRPWTDWVCWQHDERGRVDGVDGFVDLNCLRGG